MSVHFLYFLFKWKGAKPYGAKLCLIKYVKNENFNSTSHKKKKKEREREEQKHNPTSKTFLKPLKNFY